MRVPYGVAKYSKSDQIQTKLIKTFSAAQHCSAQDPPTDTLLMYSRCDEIILMQDLVRILHF